MEVGVVGVVGLLGLEVGAVAAEGLLGLEVGLERLVERPVILVRLTGPAVALAVGLAVFRAPVVS